MRLTFTEHAAERMQKGRISLADVQAVLDRGEVIERYPQDRPYPSRLVLV